MGTLDWERLPEHLHHHILRHLDLFTLCLLFFAAKDTMPRLLVEEYRGHLQLVRPLQHVSPSLSFMDIARALYHSVVVLIRTDMHHRLLWSPDLQIQGYSSTLVFFLGRQEQHDLGREASLRLAGLPTGSKAVHPRKKRANISGRDAEQTRGSGTLLGTPEQQKQARSGHSAHRPTAPVGIFPVRELL